MGRSVGLLPLLRLRLLQDPWFILSDRMRSVFFPSLDSQLLSSGVEVGEGSPPGCWSWKAWKVNLLQCSRSLQSKTAARLASSGSLLLLPFLYISRVCNRQGHLPLVTRGRKWINPLPWSRPPLHSLILGSGVPFFTLESEGSDCSGNPCASSFQALNSHVRSSGPFRQ